MKTNKACYGIIQPALAWLAALALISIPTVQAASFSYTGSMTTNRENHTATLLTNGDVLVTGGTSTTGGACLASTELYNQGSGTWTTTGVMTNARSWHTATLLANGKVLVAGSWNATAVLSSVELYDPGTGNWTLANPLNTARGAHTATLLPSGKVLVAGGTPDGTNALSSAELYDPTTGTWTMTGPLNTARADHTATLLGNGKVLVAGGASGYHFRNSIPGAELYDPATGEWTVTGAPNSAYGQGHTATLLPNGKVLAVGGDPAASTATNGAELYDPTTGVWTPTGSLTTGPRANQSATLLPNGQVLVAAGYNFTEYCLASAELYDPATGVWTATSDLNVAREWPTATLLPNGTVLIAGGKNCDTQAADASAECYSSTSGPAWVGTDDFFAGLSPSKWTTILRQGQMTVVGTNGHASFLVPVSTTSEQEEILMWNGQPTVTNDWTVEIVGHNSAGYSANGSSQFEFGCYSTTTLHTSASGYGFAISSSGGNPTIKVASSIAQRYLGAAPNADFAMRLVYSASSKNIQAWWNSTGSGPSWTLLDTISLDTAIPGMDATPTNSFTFAIEPDAYYGPISEGQLWAGNFRITNSAIGSPWPQMSLVEAFQPTLAVQPAFANLIMGATYQLQITTNLGGSFSNFGAAFTATNGSMVYPQCFNVTNGNQLFFRLQSAP